MINYILAVGCIVFGTYFVRATYKKPANLFSTDLKGYIGGFGFTIIGLMAIFGELDIPKVLNEIWNAIIK